MRRGNEAEEGKAGRGSGWREEECRKGTMEGEREREAEGRLGGEKGREERVAERG